MEAVRSLEAARLPVLTPNLKVSICVQKKGKNHEPKQCCPYVKGNFSYQLLVGI